MPARRSGGIATRDVRAGIGEDGEEEECGLADPPRELPHEVAVGDQHRCAPCGGIALRQRTEQEGGTDLVAVPYEQVAGLDHRVTGLRAVPVLDVLPIV